MQLEEVSQAIKFQNLGWEAGHTGIGHLVAQGSFGGFGLQARYKESSGGRFPRRRAALAFAVTAPLPEAIDWRSYQGRDYTTGVHDQGTCGACVAFATNAALEARLKIKMQDPYLSIDLSEAHLFFCGGPNDGCEAGWHPAEALKFCRDNGVCAERDFPYAPNQLSCDEAKRNLQIALRVSKWRRVVASAERKRAIIDRGPVIAGMRIFADFGWYRSGVYRPTTADVVGLHAVAVMGYDDRKGCWLIKNSWGTSWGEGGWARVGYGSCGIDTEFPFYDPFLV